MQPHRTIPHCVALALLVVAVSAQVRPTHHQHHRAVERGAVRPAPPTPAECRPDQVFTGGGCVQLRLSLSDLVREVLENSEGSNTFLHYHMDATGSNPTVTVPESVPVSDLFIQNLAVISEANMSSCLALATCNEHCWAWPLRNTQQRRHEELVLDKFIPPAGLTVEPISGGKSKDDVATDEDEAAGPDFVRTIMLASRKGIELAKRATNTSRPQCGRCGAEFAGCEPMQYAYTSRINAIYRQLVEANATLYDKAPEMNKNLSPEMLYYHYSMRFLDLANLTSCYARVSCENSCAVYRTTIADDSVEMVGPPPSVSPFLKEDTNKPKAIDIIHNGALIGYKLALDSGADCDQCVRHYKDCTLDRYEIARASSSIFG